MVLCILENWVLLDCFFLVNSVVIWVNRDGLFFWIFFSLIIVFFVVVKRLVGFCLWFVSGLWVVLVLNVSILVFRLVGLFVVVRLIRQVLFVLVNFVLIFIEVNNFWFFFISFIRDFVGLMLVYSVILFVSGFFVIFLVNSVVILLQWLKVLFGR